MTGLPLKGLTVLDFSRAVAGPLCTMLLADRGARVIKVEDPEGGDESRTWGTVYRGGESAYYLTLNRNKQSLALDLKSEQARALLPKLLAKADIVVENFRVGIADRLGLGFEQARALNPRVVYGSLTAFDRRGPEKDRPGYDLIMQALSGLMWANRDPNPFRVPFPITDILTGLFLNQGVLLALRERDRTGEAQQIDVNLIECMMAALCSLTPMYQLSGEEPALGSAIVPYHAFHCTNGQVVIGTPNERIFRRFAEAMGHTEWLEDARLATNRARIENKDFVLGRIQELVGGMSREECVGLLSKFEVPCAPVLSVGEAVESGRAAELHLEHPRAGLLRLSANPIHGLGVQQHPPPGLGEHTAAILAEFGLPA
jgi:crotonobetainyl-CoA:carnitine CoA-transferase CaiB-like acyl-CoA transferase